MYLRMLLFISLMTILSPVCWAATIALQDGRIYDGTLVAEDNYGYLMNIKGARVQLPRSKVSWFSNETVDHDKVTAQTNPAPAAEPVKKFGAVETPNLAGEQPIPVTNTPEPAPAPPANPPATVAPVPAPAPAAPLTPAPPMEIALPAPRDALEAAAIKQAVDSLRDDADPTNRSQAIETLRSAGDVGLAALVEYGLYNPIPSVRASAVQLLGDLGGRSVLKYLIEAFYSAAQPTIPPYNREYVRALTGQISRLTSQDYYFYERRSNRAPEVAQKMVDWWNANWDKVPLQLGEPILDATRPDYQPLIRAMRTLRLEHHDFGGANLPSDIAGPPIPNTAAENAFVQTFPIIPRVGINTGQEPSYSHTPTVEKVPAPERDYPGLLRRQEYSERLREQGLSLRAGSQPLP